MSPGWQKIFWRTRGGRVYQDEIRRVGQDGISLFESHGSICTRGPGTTSSRGLGKEVLLSSSSSGMDDCCP